MSKAQLIIETKPIARVPKSAIRTLIGRMINYTAKYEYQYAVDVSSCSISSCLSCNQYTTLLNLIEDEKNKDYPDFNLLAQLMQQLDDISYNCYMSGCKHAIMKKAYQNDTKRYNTYKYASRRLPKTCIKLFLLLYSIPVQKLGNCHFINDMPVNALSDKLDVCPLTIEKSLRILESFNYITLAHGSSLKSYNIMLNDYDDMHLSAKQGGTGYFSATKDMINELLKITNVNALRLEVLKILKADDYSYLKTTGIDNYRIKDLKTVLPTHMNYQDAFAKLQTQPSLFNSNVQDGKVTFFMKQEYSLRINILDYQLSHYDDFSNFLNEHKLFLHAADIFNLCDMTTEFSISMIKKAVLCMLSFMRETKHKIKNTGAYIRTLCRKMIVHDVNYSTVALPNLYI